VCAGDEKAGTCEASKPSREAGSQAHRAGEGRLVTESPRAHKTTSKASVFCVARTSKLLCLCGRLEGIFYVDPPWAEKQENHLATW
jgi:tRNA G37 N-methylase TrmD